MFQGSYPKPSWRPPKNVDLKWVAQCFERYVAKQNHYCIYANGTCVATASGDVEQFDKRLLNVVQRSPDFQVRLLADGNYLVGFRGPVLGFMSGTFLRENISWLRSEALAFGVLPNEKFTTTEAPHTGEDDLIAGIYVRANLYLDAETPHIMVLK